MAFKMKGMSFNNSAVKQKVGTDTTKKGDYTQYEHPTYYNYDGSINKGSSTGDFDEGELSEVMKNQNGKRYVEQSDGKLLFLDKPE